MRILYAYCLYYYNLVLMQYLQDVDEKIDCCENKFSSLLKLSKHTFWNIPFKLQVTLAAGGNASF